MMELPKDFTFKACSLEDVEENTLQAKGTDISQKDEKPIKKRQNRTRDGK
ncbi:hypothetical protein Tco_1578856, partial [Tanacetum coccineum]